MTAGDVQSLRGATSFEDFYRREYAPVVRLAFALSGRMDIAEELAQDGFLAAHRDWERISTYERPEAWIRRVVTNRCVSTHRRALTQHRLLARLRLERSPDVELSPPSEELWALVRALPRRQAQAVALAFVEDLAVSDIAAVLGCGEESVRTHLRRGRAALARRLQEGDADA